MPDLLKRERLYELLWTVPISRLCRDLDISRAGRAFCRANIPVPPHVLGEKFPGCKWSHGLRRAEHVRLPRPSRTEK